MKDAGDDLEARLLAFLRAGNAAAAQLRGVHGLPITINHVQEALEEVLAVEDAHELLRQPLDAAEMIRSLGSYPFAALFPEILGEIVIERSVLPAQTIRRLDERTVKVAGEIWRIHKNDADPFPSNPHAHNLESGLKLHLGTGGLFRKRVLVDHIGPKDLEAIREKLVGIALPPRR